MAQLRLTCTPLTPSRWPDLEDLFGARGACGGCWCMWWRLPRAKFEKNKGAQNKKAFRKLVMSGNCPGLLAYSGKEIVGWCAVEPRETYSALERSRILKPVDDRPVWSVTCLFIRREYRSRGVSVRLLKAAADHARSRGARMIEGYPVEPRKEKMPDVFAWTRLASGFIKAGYKEVERRSPTRPIMRKGLRPR